MSDLILPPTLAADVLVTANPGEPGEWTGTWADFLAIHAAAIAAGDLVPADIAGALLRGHAHERPGTLTVHLTRGE